MKKLLTLLVAVLLSSSIFSSAHAAHQDNSFLNSATSGIFEENYDLFKFSPAYMPSFERNAFWGQLSNLRNENDQIVANSANNSYLLGGHTDVVGLGRAGLMWDWYSSSSPQSSTPWNPTGVSPGSHSGFGEYDFVEYQDTNGDDYMDIRRDVYARSEETTHYSTTDLYVAYGLGGIAGLDLGAALRINWESNQPTYYDGNMYSSNNGSFDWYGTETQRDLITNQRVYTYNTEGTGSLDYGDNEWRLILSGRSKDMMGIMPGLDVIVNIEPILKTVVNKLEWDHFYAYDDEPDSTTNISDYRREYTEKGVDEGEDLPGTGFGVGGDIRLDYETNFFGAENIKNHIIADINVEYVGVSIADAKHEEQRHTIDRDTVVAGMGTELEVDEETRDYNYTWEGDSSEFDLSAKLRALWLMENWDFGIGAGITTNTTNQKTTRDYTYTEVDRHDRYNASNSDDYTQTVTSGYKTDEESTTIINTLELPLAIKLKVLSNFAIQMGAMHTITLTQSDSSSRNYERSLQETYRVNDDGSTTYSLEDTATNEEATSFSTLTASHNTQLTYGVTWWPFEQVRIDMKGLTNIFALTNYRVSVNIYY